MAIVGPDHVQVAIPEGARIGRGGFSAGYARFFTEDPFGNRIELMERV